MAKWSLIYPPFEDMRDRSAYYVAPPLGLLSIASYLEQAEHEVSIHDFVYRIKAGLVPRSNMIYDVSAEQILSDDPDVVAFGTQCSTGPGSLNIARRIKRLKPDTTIVLGGHDVSFLGKQYLDAFPFVDAVLGGEAELTITMLADALSGQRTFEGIPSLTWRDAGTSRHCSGDLRINDLDSMLPPSYHLVDALEEYFALSTVPTILIDSGRGCAFACEFCQTTLLTGRKVRYRSVSSLIAELRALRDRYGPFEAYFVHDLFTARRRFVEELCTSLISSDLDLKWQCRCRLDQVDEALLELMSEAGCSRLLYGVESGSERTLDTMNKRLRKGVEPEVLTRVRWTVDAGIFPSLSMVVGIPEETLADLNATMSLAADFVLLGKANSFIQLMSPLPGTQLANRLLDRLMYRGDDAPTAFSQGIEFGSGKRLEEDEELIKTWPQIFQSFYVVTPDHNDLDLCVDVSLAYCKLLEVYGWTFTTLAKDMSLTFLDLFQRFRSYCLENRGHHNMVGMRDFEIWDAFAEFCKSFIAQRNPSPKLRDTFEFELIVHQLATVPPVVESEALSAQTLHTFNIHPAARLFRPSIGLPWDEDKGNAVAEKAAAYLVFMGRDRLHVLKLADEMADAIDIVGELAIVSELANEDHVLDSHWSVLARALAPLSSLGVLQPNGGVVRAPC